MSKLKWKRSSDGFCESKCDRYHIVPLYCSCVKPQFFELWFYPEGSGTPEKTRLRKKLSSMDSTQRESKEHAQEHHDKQGGA